MCELWMCGLWKELKSKGVTEGSISVTSEYVEFGLDEITIEETATFNGETIGTRLVTIPKAFRPREMNEYFCEIDDGGEGSRPVKAGYCEEAALLAVKQNDSDSAEYYCANGNDVTVKVRHGVTGEVKVFTVSGWSEAAYSATEVK